MNYATEVLRLFARGDIKAIKNINEDDYSVKDNIVTLLGVAITNNRSDVVQYILAKYDISDKDIDYAINVAEYHKLTDMATMIHDLRYGKIKSPSVSNINMMAINATVNDNLSDIDYCIVNGYNFIMFQNHLLCLAATHGSINVMNYLLDMGVVDKPGLNVVLELAISADHPWCVDALLKYGADLTHVSKVTIAAASDNMRSHIEYNVSSSNG